MLKFLHLAALLCALAPAKNGPSFTPKAPLAPEKILPNHGAKKVQKSKKDFSFGNKEKFLRRDLQKRQSYDVQEIFQTDPAVNVSSEVRVRGLSQDLARVTIDGVGQMP